MKAVSRKDRERLAKRQAILGAARQVFAAKGLHAATLDEIAERAEFAKGTLYCYFKNKDDLFISMLEAEIAQFGEDLRQVAMEKSPVPARFEKMVRTMLQLFEDNVDLMKLMIRERPGMTAHQGNIRAEERLQPLFKRLTEVVGGLIKQGTRQGTFRAVDVQRTAIAFFNLIHGSAMNCLWRKQRIADEQEVRFITDLFLRGIQARP